MTAATVALTSGHITVGNSSNVAADVAMSGDATIDNTGAVIVNNVVSLADFYTDASTTHTDGTYDILYTYTLPSNTLNNNGDKLEILFAGLAVGSATPKEENIKVTFGGIDLFADFPGVNYGSLGADNPPSWKVRTALIRTGSSTARIIQEVGGSFIYDSGTGGSYLYDGPETYYADLSGLDFTSTNAIELTARSFTGAAAAGDITAKMGYIRKIKAAA